MEEQFEWDEEKAAINLTRHEISFPDAVRIWKWGAPVLEEQDRDEDAELRYRSLGLTELGVLFVVWTSRGSRRRIISARRAERKEKRRYDAYCTSLYG